MYLHRLVGYALFIFLMFLKVLPTFASNSSVPPQYQALFSTLPADQQEKALKMIQNQDAGTNENFVQPKIFEKRLPQERANADPINGALGRQELDSSLLKHLPGDLDSGDYTLELIQAMEIQDPILRQIYLNKARENYERRKNDPFSELKAFGYDLFASSPTTFAPATDIPVPQEYIIGPGDKFEITLFGKVSAQHSLVVHRDGSINIPNLGLVRVGGLEFKDAREVILSRIKNQKIGVTAVVTMGELRSMRVFVLGDAWQPGSYTVSALSTISHAIMVSGGVKESGSLRKIQLKRNGEVVTEFDLYDFLLKGDTSKDLKLLPGDAVFIPPVGSIISVAGEVNRPAIYELKDEQRLQEVIDLAGGLKPTADQGYVQLHRIKNGKQQELLDLDTSKLVSLETKVKSGDKLIAYSVIDHFEQVVTIQGHVKRERQYQWRKGLRVSDVLGDISVFEDQVDLRYVLLKRINPESRSIEFYSVNLVPIIFDFLSPHNIELQPRDELTVLSLDSSRSEQLEPITTELKYQSSAFELPLLVEVQGAVTNPGTYPYLKGMNLSDLFETAKGYQRSESEPYNLFGVIERVDPQTKNRSFKTFLPYRVLVNSDDLSLQPGDRVFFFDESHIGYLSSADIHDVLNGEEPSSLRLKSDGILVTKQLQEQTDALLKKKQQGVMPAQVRSQVSSYQNIDDSDFISQESKDAITGLCKGLIQLAEVVNSEGGSRIKRAIATQSTAEQVSLKNVMQCPDIYEEYPYLLPMLMEYVVAVQGESREPGLYPLAEPVDAAFMIEALGGITQDGDLSIVEIASVRNTASNGQIFRNLDLVVGSHQAFPGDIISVRPKETQVEKGVVKLAGEFVYPGVYSFRKGETLSQLITRAGGLTKDAYPYGAVFTRESTRKLEQKAFKRAAEELNSALFTAIASGTFKSAGGADGIAMLQSLTSELEETEALGRIVVEADPSILDVRPELDIKLEVGDTLFMPKRTRTVSVVGQVLNPGTLLFDPEQNAIDYLDQSGGYSESADEDRVFIVLPNGSARSLQASWWNYKPTNIPPGSTIIVPRDARPVDWLALTQSVTSIASQLAITAASLATISDN
ncbi:SLBB domain-containing protein [Litoribrevibacter euphylliae]|uniref:SLBB domain-containing protein n=1 Tax=Litoribrevibacter euphylliae TaxID=1834034 RepID=A0ABV7H8S8_9GAMM